jgi:hypothetical protein
MKSAGQYKFPKALSDGDLRRFTLVFGLYSLNPCSSVESVVNAKKAAIIFTKLCKTKPICRGCEIKLSSVFIKGYEEMARLAGI